MSVQRVPFGEPALLSASFFSDAAQTQEVEPGDVQLVIHPPGEADVTVVVGDMDHDPGSNDYLYRYSSPSWGDVRGYWKSTNPDVVIPFVYEVFAV